jgi:hypothetical protein
VVALARILAIWLFVQEAELYRALENTRHQKAYSFSYERVGSKTRVAGVYNEGTLYLRSGGIELARGREATMVKIGRDGEWRDVAWFFSSTQKTDKNRNLIEDLLQIPAPHTLMPRAVAECKRPAGKEGDPDTCVSDLNDSYAREVLKQKWFAQPDARRWSETRGLLAVTVNAEHLISVLQFELRGKLLPEDPRGIPKKAPKKPDPRSAKRFTLPPVAAAMKIRLGEFGKATLPLPEEILHRLGIRE